MGSGGCWGYDFFFFLVFRGAELGPYCWQREVVAVGWLIRFPRSLLLIVIVINS